MSTSTIGRCATSGSALARSNDAAGAAARHTLTGRRRSDPLCPAEGLVPLSGVSAGAFDHVDDDQHGDRRLQEAREPAGAGRDTAGAPEKVAALRAEELELGGLGD